MENKWTEMPVRHQPAYKVGRFEYKGIKGVRWVLPAEYIVPWKDELYVMAFFLQESSTMDPYGMPLYSLRKYDIPSVAYGGSVEAEIDALMNPGKQPPPFLGEDAEPVRIDSELDGIEVIEVDPESNSKFAGYVSICMISKASMEEVTHKRPVVLDKFQVGRFAQHHNRMCDACDKKQ